MKIIIPEISNTATREEVRAWYENLMRQVLAIGREAAKKKKRARKRGTKIDKI
jgi:hypothetical protein